MKKTFTVVLIIATTFSTSLHAQAIRATYTLKRLKDNITAVYTGGFEETDSYKEESTQPPTIYSYLYCSGKSLTIMTDDGGFSKSSDPSKNYTVIAPSEETFYKDIEKNHFHMQWIVSGKPESRVGQLMDFKWQITNEKAVISGYKCLKAVGVVGEYKVVAWFAKDIKVNDGPTRFSGLPGLIVKVNLDDVYEIEASNIRLTNEVVVINEPDRKV